MAAAEALPALALPQGRFVGIEVFRQHLRAALAQAAAAGWRELLLCDATFADWPLGERCKSSRCKNQPWPSSRLGKSASPALRQAWHSIKWLQRWRQTTKRACRRTTSS